MDPQDLSPSLEAMQEQINQAMLEHQIVVQALRAQCLISAAFVVALSLLSFWMWRRSVYSAEALVAQAKRHYTESSAREERHSLELIALHKENAMALDSITRMSWREFAELVLKMSGAPPKGSG